MKSRRASLLALTSGLVALAVVAGPAIADELVGVITGVDVEGKKVTVVEKGTRKEIEVTINDDTEFVTPKGARKVDLEKLAKGVAKAKERNGRGMYVHITHEDAVASKIEVAKKAAPKRGDER